MSGRIRDLDTVREVVRKACDLVEVIKFYGHEFAPFSVNHVVTPCPFHAEKEPSFAVNTEKQVYYCYGCKVKGDVFTFVQRQEGIPFLDALRWLAQWGDVDISKWEAPETKEEKRKRKLLSLNRAVLDEALTNTNAKKFKAWWVGRALTSEILEHFQVGYSPEPWWPDGTSAADTKALGLKTPMRWTETIVVPILDDSGHVVAFRNRSTDDGPKTIAASNDHPLDIPPIYGWAQAKGAARKSGRVILVEGEVDVWQMWAHGFEDTCGSFGTNISMEMLDYLHERGVSEVVFMPDGDEAGRKFAKKVAATRHRDVAIKVAILSGGDPDDLLLQDPDIITAALEAAQYGIEFLVREVTNQELFTLTQKQDALNELKDVILGSTKVEQQLAFDMLAEALGLDPVIIADFYREQDPGTEKLHDVRAEKSALTRALQGDEYTGEMVLGLRADDFYLRKHQQIFEAIDLLYRGGQEISRDTVSITLQKIGHDTAVDYLDTMEGDTEGASIFMLEVLKDKASRRKLYDVGRQVITDSTNPTLTTPDLTAGAMAAISSVVVGGDIGLSPVLGSVHSVIDRMHERIKNPNLIVGYDLGSDWQSLNRNIHGLQTKRLFCLAAPSGVGKTTAMISFMSRLSVDLEIPTLVLTLETSKDTLVQRTLAHRSGVTQEAIQTGFMDEEQVELIHQAAAEVGAAPLVITKRGQVFEEAQAIIQHDVMQRGTKIVMIDYIQLMSKHDTGRKSRHELVGEISRGLLEITDKLDITAIILAQINREGTKKGGAADHTDVGDAFKIAQDADIFVTLTEKSKEEIEDDGLDKGNRKMLMSKNRADGPIGVWAYMHADTATQRLREIPS